MRPLWLAAIVSVALASAAQADIYRLLDGDQDALQARVDVFQQAHHEIDALYFLARNDSVTLTALALMRDARRRGVESVRLIVDANYQHIPKPILGYLRDEGVQIKVYHPLTLRHPLWIFYRMHEKVVVADGKRYITGGRNLAEDYFGLAKKNYVDRDVYVEGASAADADRHFENLWVSKHVADLNVQVSPAEKIEAEKMLNDAVVSLQGGKFIALNTGKDWSEGQTDVGSVEFLHDPVVANSGPRVGTRLAEVLDQAKHSIVLETPYLVPSRSVLRLLDKKLAQGVHVTIVTNSRKSNDGLLTYVAYLKYRRHMIRSGIDLREYKGPDCLHAKSAIIDDRLALVGSYNIDPRSENLNTEVMSVADDPVAAEQLRAAIDAHANNSWKIARRDPNRTSRLTRFRIWAVRKLLLPFVEKQL